MQVTSVGTYPTQPTGTTANVDKAKQLFQKIGTALESGDLSDAKAALTQLQAIMPAKAGNANDPLAAKMQALTQAVDSGDLKGAQQAYSDVKSALAQGPSGGRPGGGASSGGGARKASGSGGTSSSGKTYDKKDTNKDGIVSAQEELAYDLSHPNQSDQSSNTTGSGSVNLTV